MCPVCPPDVTGTGCALAYWESLNAYSEARLAITETHLRVDYNLHIMNRMLPLCWIALLPVMK